MADDYDAIVIGSGPNGLAAAITLARAGKSVLLREGASTCGGSMRSASITGDGFINDICSTVQAMAGVSPFFKSLPLRELGVRFLRPPIAFAQPFDDGPCAGRRRIGRRDRKPPRSRWQSLERPVRTSHPAR